MGVMPYPDFSANALSRAIGQKICYALHRIAMVMTATVRTSIGA